MTRFLTACLLALLPTTAFAGKCDALVKKASTAKGDDLVAAFESLLECDKAEAEASFDEFMRNAAEVGLITRISLASIDAEAYTPVWNMMEKIPDYSARDGIAKGIGEACAEHDKVNTFLQGAYFGLRDIQFGQWDDALVTCQSESLTGWMDGIVAKPPTTSYDEKYNTILSAYVKRKGPDALSALEKAAIQAANNGGPFNAVIEKMELAVQPQELGADVPEADRKRLEESMKNVANEVGPEQAAMVADRLFNAGAESAAASLLPRVYPDRVQSGGRLLYGAAAIESCDKQAVIHVVEVMEASKRWSIKSDVEGPLRGLKKRLKCDSGEWPVLITPEPVASKGDVDTWSKTLVEEWEGKGMDVKVRAEKGLELN